MKKIFLLFLALIPLIAVRSQCNLTIPYHINVCEDSCVGIVNLFVSDGVVPLTFITPTDTFVFTNPNVNDFSVLVRKLCPGQQSFTVTNGNGCTIDTTVTISQFPPFEADLIIASPNSSGSTCDGILEPIATLGGIPPLNALFMNCEDSLSLLDGTNLCPGSYFAFVRDSTGCGSYTPCISTEILSLNKVLLDEIKINIEQNHLQINQPYDLLKIYSLSGQVVLESDIPQQLLSIDQLASGPYIVSVLKDGKLFTEKIMKTSP